MKNKTIITGILVFTLMACGENTIDDKPGEENPSAFSDSTVHPNGMSSGSVISTDTAAMKVDTGYQR